MSQFGEQADSHKAGELIIPSNQWNSNIAVDLETIKDNLFEIKKNIVPCKTEIIAVTKYFGLDAIKKGYEAGLRNFGESRAIEAIEKINALPQEIQKNSKFHFIGHLQTNKVERVVEKFDVIHSIDSIKLAKAVSQSACRINKRERILLQVNNAKEEQKFGYDKELLEKEFSEILELSGIEVIGLMNMAPLGAEEKLLKELFSDLRKFRDKLETVHKVRLPELSMGMSDDYKIAVQEGATMIRIGRKLFT